MSSTILRRFAVLAGIAVAMAVAAPNPLLADVITTIDFAGQGLNKDSNTGNIVGAEAYFIIDSTTNTLTIKLRNATPAPAAGHHLQQGDVLTGIVFNINGASPKLSLSSTSPKLTSGSVIYTDATHYNTTSPLAGSWTNKLGTSPLRSYGVAATGFNGA